MNEIQQEKVARFRALHAAPGAFVIPNPWDAGSARMLQAMGFEALATSSSASAGTMGKRDYGLTRSEAIAMTRVLVDATDVPVSADLEYGFGDDEAAVVATVRAAAEIGLAGLSIEDARGDAAPYELAHATARIAAAVAANRALAVPMVLTARAENYLRGKPDLADTIRRLQAYEQAGADVLFATGLPDLAAVRAVCAAVRKPVNVIAGVKGRPFTVANLAEAGARRISVATSFYRAALTGLRDAALEVRTRGTFTYGETAMSGAEVAAFLR